jgi:hypothetical protein
MEEGEEKERKRKKSLWKRRVSPGLDPRCWLNCGSQLLGTIKG